MNLKLLVKRFIPASILNKKVIIQKQIRNLKILAIDYGQYKTINYWISVDKDNNPIPWFTYPAIEWLNNLDLKHFSVFEYGSGLSTLYWSRKCRKVVSVEDDEKWYNFILDKSGPLSNISCNLEKNEREYIKKIDEYNEQFDIYVIDGKYRSKCARKVVEHVKKYGGNIIIFDNSDWYPNTIDFLRRSLDWIEVDFCGFGPINDYCWITTMFFNRNLKLSYIKNLSTVGGLIQIAEGDS